MSPLTEVVVMRSLLTFTLASVCVVGAAIAAEPVVVPFGKLKSAVPADWKSEKTSNRLRSHQFKLPAPDAAFADAELYVMPESDPRTEKNFPKWKATFTPPEGKAEADTTKESTFEAGGATVHLLDVSGTWRYKPFPMAKTEEERPDSRAVWAIVVHGEEATHVRLAGPAAVVEKHYPAFEAWLKAIK